MWKVILSSFLVTASAFNNDTDTGPLFNGEWTPVAFYPAVVYFQACLQVAFSLDPDNVVCRCADGKYTELVHATRVVDGANVDWGKPTFPYMEVKDENETFALNVNCACGDRDYNTRVVGRPLGKNYYVLYKHQDLTDKEPNAAVIYAREIPAYASLLEVMMSVDDLRNRDGEVMCTSEYKYAEMLSKMKIT